MSNEKEDECDKHKQQSDRRARSPYWPAAPYHCHWRWDMWRLATRGQCSG